MVVALDCICKKKHDHIIRVDTSGGNELSLKGGWPLLRGEVKNSVIREGIRVEVLLPNVERSQLKWFRYLTRMDPG